MLKELKDKFIREFTPAERLLFLKKAKEAVEQKGYPAGEDLFQYCYFLTLKERMNCIDGHGGEGFMRFLLVESKQDIEKEVKYFE